MKNLKKFGAVALAAVMAVTFAPVASLNVFAANNVGVDADNEIRSPYSRDCGDGRNSCVGSGCGIAFFRHFLGKRKGP